VRGRESVLTLVTREKAGMVSEKFSRVHGGESRPGMLVLDIRGNAGDGSVPEGVGVVEEIANVTPAAPSNGKVYVRMRQREVRSGTGRPPISSGTRTRSPS
jgi:hypothetical protein